MEDGTAFVHITNPTEPEVIGMLPTHTTFSMWRDVKVYKNHAFIVSEARGHGMQVIRSTLEFVICLQAAQATIYFAPKCAENPPPLLPKIDFPGLILKKESNLVPGPESISDFPNS